MGVIPSVSTKNQRNGSGLCGKVLDSDGHILSYQFSLMDGKYKVECPADNSRCCWPFNLPVYVDDKKVVEALPVISREQLFEDGYLHFVVGKSHFIHIKTDHATEFKELIVKIHNLLMEGQFFDVFPRLQYVDCTVLDYSVSLCMEARIREDSSLPSLGHLAKWFTNNGVEGVKVRDSSDVDADKHIRNGKQRYSVLFPLNTVFNKEFPRRRTYQATLGINYGVNEDDVGITKDKKVFYGPVPGRDCEVSGVKFLEKSKCKTSDNKEISQITRYSNFLTLDFLETETPNCLAEYAIRHALPFCINHHKPLIPVTREVLKEVSLLDAICKDVTEFNGFDTVLPKKYKVYEARVMLGEVDESLHLDDEDINDELASALEQATEKNDFMHTKFSYPAKRIVSKLFSEKGKIYLSVEVST